MGPFGACTCLAPCLRGWPCSTSPPCPPALIIPQHPVQSNLYFLSDDPLEAISA